MESTVQVGFNCLNCKNPVDPNKVKLFQGVFTCETCHELAERTFRRLEKELRHLLTLSGEAIRLALIKGELRLGPADMREIPKSELMRRVMEMAAKKDQEGS